jgi:hypothetical protein
VINIPALAPNNTPPLGLMAEWFAVLPLGCAMIWNIKGFAGNFGFISRQPPAAQKWI